MSQKFSFLELWLSLLGESADVVLTNSGLTAVINWVRSSMFHYPKSTELPWSQFSSDNQCTAAEITTRRESENGHYKSEGPESLLSFSQGD